LIHKKQNSPVVEEEEDVSEGGEVEGGLTTGDVGPFVHSVEKRVRVGVEVVTVTGMVLVVGT